MAWAAWWLAAAVAVASLGGVARAQIGYAVGFGVRDITPTTQMIENGEVYLGGYGIWKERGLPTGVHDPVWARAFVVEVNGTAVANCVLDLVGIANGALYEIRDRVVAETNGGIDKDAVLVSSTHTHAAPDLQGIWGGASAAYRQLVIDATVAAIVEAYEVRKPARLFLSVGNAQGNNRRGWGYTDEDVTVLDVFDAATNARLGTVINFAAHPVTLDDDNLLVSSDYCHYLRVHAEAALNATVLFFNGIEGDVNARGEGSSFAKAESYGIEVAEAALASLPAQEEVTGPAELVVLTHHYRHLVTNVYFLAAFRIGMAPDYQLNDDRTFNLQVTYFRIGKALQAITSPGESLTRNGLPVKDAMVAKYRMFLGLSTNTIGYLVPTDEWNMENGGYEEDVSIDEYFGDTTRDLQILLIRTDNSNIPTTAATVAA